VSFTFQLIRLHQLQLLALSPIVAVPAAMLRYQEGVVPDATFWDLPFALPFAAYAVGGTLLTATITRMIVPDGVGRYPSLAGSVQAVVNDLPALAAIGLASTVVIVLAFLLLVVPGLILGVLLAVPVPVRTIERASFVQSCVRSAVLTKGSRRVIFGLLIAIIVLEVAGDVAVNIVTGDAIFAGYSEELRSNGAASILVATLVATAVSVIGATGTAVLYCELRRIKDGPAPTELASEFD
jgi:hypothetical protein